MIQTANAARPHPLNDRYKHLSVLVPDQNPHVIIVALDRPRKRNAMNAELWLEIGDVFGKRLGQSGDGCRCVIVTGNPKCFTAGLDISDSTFFPSSDVKDVAHRGITFLPKILEMQECLTAIEKCPVPVIASVSGPCIGAGVDLISACDIRLCDRSAVFCVKEAQIGLAADVGTLQRFPGIIGNDSLARELCYTAMPFGSEEALSMGLVSRVAADHDALTQAAMTIASAIAANSPVAIRGTKKSLLFSRDHSVADGLHHVASHNALALLTDDLPVAFRSMARGKRGGGDPPKFADIPAHSRL